MDSSVPKAFEEQKMQQKIEVRGWKIPAAKTTTFKNLMQMSKAVGASVQLHYHPRRREFTIYTLNRGCEKLQALMTQGGFPEQVILLNRSHA